MLGKNRKITTTIIFILFFFTMFMTFVPMMVSVYEVLARGLIAFTLPTFIGYLGICIANPIAWFSAAIPLVFNYRRKIT